MLYILTSGFSFAVIIYSLLFDIRLFAIYAIILAIYSIIHICIKDESLNSMRSKIRYGVWNGASGPETYVKILCPMKPFEDFAQKKLEQGLRISMTHVALKALAHAMALNKSLKGKIIFNKFVESPGVNINTIIDMDGTDVGTQTFENCDKKSITEISEDVRGCVKKIKTKQDTGHQKRTKGLGIVPDWLVSIILQLCSFISYNLGLPTPNLPKKNFFGNCFLTNLSAFGYTNMMIAPIDFSRGSSGVALCSPFWDMVCDKDGSNQRMEKMF